MTKFVNRRIRNGLITIVTCLIILIILRVYGTPLYRMQIWSGWILFGLVIFLMLYNLKKKLPMLPLGSSAIWLQFHGYVGIISMIMFLQHINLRLPSGNFEILFAILFILTALTGVVGIILSRVVPKYLTRTGEEVIFERIPIFTLQLRQQVEALVLECAKETGTVAMNDYYQKHLAEYFLGPRNVLFHLIASNTPLYLMQKKHATFCRYLNKKEKEFADEILALVAKKNDLDFHFALQGILKAWGFLHVPLTYSLIVAAVVHVTLVYAFIGGV